MKKLLICLAVLAGCADVENRKPIPDRGVAAMTTPRDCIVFPRGNMAHLITGDSYFDEGPCRNCNLDLDNDGWMDAIAGVQSKQ